MIGRNKDYTTGDTEFSQRMLDTFNQHLPMLLSNNHRPYAISLYLTYLEVLRNLEAIFRLTGVTPLPL